MQLPREFQAHSTSKALTELLLHWKGGRFRTANEGVRPTAVDRAPPGATSHHYSCTYHGIRRETAQHRPAGLGWNSKDFPSSACWPESAGNTLTRGKLESKTLTTSVLQPLWIVDGHRRGQSSAHKDPGAVLPLPWTSTNTGD